MNGPRILVVEDDVHFLPALCRILERHYVVTETRTAESALDLVLGGYEFDIILSDMGLAGWSGGDLYKRLARRRDPHAGRVVILSGLDVAVVHPALAADLGDRVLAKPISPAALLAALQTVRDRAAA